MARLMEDKYLRQQQVVKNEYYNGTAHVRVFTCPEGEVATHATQSLSLGKPLLAIWGGDGGTDPEDPLLQELRYGKRRDNGLQELVATFVSVNTRA